MCFGWGLAVPCRIRGVVQLVLTYCCTAVSTVSINGQDKPHRSPTTSCPIFPHNVVPLRPSRVNRSTDQYATGKTPHFSGRSIFLRVVPRISPVPHATHIPRGTLTDIGDVRGVPVVRAESACGLAVDLEEANVGVARGRQVLLVRRDLEAVDLLGKKEQRYLEAVDLLGREQGVYLRPWGCRCYYLLRHCCNGVFFFCPAVEIFPVR